MKSPSASSRLGPPLSNPRRTIFLVLSLGLIAGLGVARWLEPSPEGLGTHRQLGFPPCTFVALFGVPCPSCGMTTSWAWLTRGQLSAALDANVAGTLLACLAILAVCWMGSMVIVGRHVGPRFSEKAAIILLLAVGFVAILDWTSKLIG